MTVPLVNQMPAVDELLDTDHANVPETQKLLAAFHPRLPEAINMPAVLYTTLARVLADSDEESRDVKAFNAIALSLGARNRAELDAILARTRKTKRERQLVAKLHQAEHRREARRVRAVIVLMMFRAYMWAATDIMRMRLTPAMGYGRQLAEGFALLSLIASNPGVGRRWLRIANDAAGERFYLRYQGKLIDEMVKPTYWERMSADRVLRCMYASPVRRAGSV